MRGKITQRKWMRGMVLFAILLCSTLAFVGNSSSAAGTAEPVLERQAATNLYQAGKFTVSKENINLSENKKANGVMISGDAKDLSKAVFRVGDLQDFQRVTPEYMVIDALAERKKSMTLAFYIDNAKKPFATVDLAKQKKKENWATVKNRCINLSGTKLAGKHQISFKVRTKETGNLSLVFRAITFMKNEIPAIEFNLDETQGSIAAMNGDSSHDTECYGNVTINIPEGYQSEYTDKECTTVTYKLDYIRGRGNSTWSSDKKPYKFKLEKKRDLLGMGKSKHWVLLANYYDITMLRNKLTYWLGEQLGMEFTPQCEFVDVIMNGEYLGSYYLCEQIRVEESRVAIDDLEKDEYMKQTTGGSLISGGYLLGMFPYGDETGQSFSTESGLSFLIESPSFEDSVNEVQLNYIKDYVQKTENAIMGKDFQDDTGKSYQAYLDIDSAVDYYWMQEFSMNGDAFYSTSTYLYKKRNGKLYWGPLWDFDFVAWGATEYYENYCTGFTQNNNAWFGRLFEDPVFYKKVVDRWPAIKSKLLEACKDGGQIDLYSAKQYESQKHNYEIWSKYSDMYGNFFYEEDGATGSGALEISYDSEVARLKEWIRTRIEWIDENIESLKKEYCTITFMVDDLEFAAIQVEKDNSIMEFPVEPSKEGYVFKGWYAMVEEDGESYEYKLTGYEAIQEDLTVKAVWIEESAMIPVEQIGFAREEYYIPIYDTLYLRPCLIPFDADNNGLTWESSDENVATVSDGLVMAQYAKGDAVITVTAANGVSASCVVHIIDYREYVGLNDIQFESSEISVKVGEYVKLPILYEPNNAVIYSELMFASSDETIVKVDASGYVYGAQEGTAVVVCCLPEIGIRLCNINVTE